MLLKNSEAHNLLQTKSQSYRFSYDKKHQRPLRFLGRSGNLLPHTHIEKSIRDYISNSRFMKKSVQSILDMISQYISIDYWFNFTLSLEVISLLASRTLFDR